MPKSFLHCYNRLPEAGKCVMNRCFYLMILESEQPKINRTTSVDAVLLHYPMVGGGRQEKEVIPRVLLLRH